MGFTVHGLMASLSMGFTVAQSTPQELYTWSTQELYTWSTQELYTWSTQELYTWSTLVSDSCLYAGGLTGGVTVFTLTLTCSMWAATCATGTACAGYSGSPLLPRITTKPITTSTTTTATTA